jgi:hypothetical protein
MPTRVPLTERLHRLTTLDKVAEMRLAGQTWRSIGIRLGISPAAATRLFNEYYATKSTQADISHNARKNERRDQLETLDELAMRVALGASTAAGRAAGGFNVRDLLAAVEGSRRVKSELLKLDGLGGDNASSKAGAGVKDGDAPPPEDGEKNTALTIRRWIDGLRERHPELYAAFARTFGEESPATHGPREEQGNGDQSGSDPARDADAAIEPAAPVASADP